MYYQPSKFGDDMSSDFYRACARGIATVNCPSVRPSVRLSVCTRVPGHMYWDWASSKVIK